MPFLAEYSKTFGDNQCLYAVHIFCMIGICVVHERCEYASPKLSCQISKASSSAVAMKQQCAKMLTLTLTTGRNSPQHNFEIGEDFAVAEPEPVARHCQQETEHSHAHQHLQLSAIAKGIGLTLEALPTRNSIPWLSLKYASKGFQTNGNTLLYGGRVSTVLRLKLESRTCVSTVTFNSFSCLLEDEPPGQASHLAAVFRFLLAAM
jgi:hypothetical protein